MAIQSAEERPAATSSGFVYITIGLLGLVVAGALFVTRPMGPTLAIVVARLPARALVSPRPVHAAAEPGGAAAPLRQLPRHRPHGGLRWANPFYSKTKISVRAHNFNSEKLKVNDLRGNPIEIAATVVWRVDDTARASFDVENYEAYVLTQAESALRHLALSYAYDNLEDPGSTSKTEVTLRSGTEEVSTRCSPSCSSASTRPAGRRRRQAHPPRLRPEIAGTMLRRQQAEAVIAARTKIVQGAVGMVELALNGLRRARPAAARRRAARGDGQQPARRPLLGPRRDAGDQHGHALQLSGAGLQRERRWRARQEVVPAAHRSGPVGRDRAPGGGRAAQRQRAGRVPAAHGARARLGRRRTARRTRRATARRKR
jgi:hypothetical protein